MNVYKNDKGDECDDKWNCCCVVLCCVEIEKVRDYKYCLWCNEDFSEDYKFGNCDDFFVFECVE